MPTSPDAPALSGAPRPTSRRSAPWFSRVLASRGVLTKGLVLGAALMLAGCQADEVSYGGYGPKANRPIAPATFAKMRELNMSASAPILIRLFKQESVLEVWKKAADGKFALLKTYEICKWSGELGPKIKEGDRQAPEGFYSITPGLMNPNSSYHLAFNMGYPNAYDRSHGRTGSHLMVHGACSSRGCYAMEDKQIQDIYALGREAFKGGQRSFQVQAYPFRMTPENLAKYDGNPNMPFWLMLKEGNDNFEVTRLEPQVDVCGRQYVFNAKSADPNRGLDASRPCPILDVPQEISIAVASKKQKDEESVRQIVAAMKAKQQKMEENKARDLMIASAIDKTKDKGPVPLAPSASEPAADEAPSEATQIMIASGVPLPVAAPGRAPSQTAVAAATKPQGVGGFFTSVFSFASGSSDAAAAADAASAPPAAETTTEVASLAPATGSTPPAGAPATAADTAPAAASATATATAVPVPPPAPAAGAADAAAAPTAAPGAAAPVDSAAPPTETAAAPAEQDGNFLSKAFGSLFGG